MEPIIDIYSELQIPRFSDEKEIKKGLRKVTIELHPDNHVNDSAATQKELAERLGLLSQICNFLYVPENKQFYDEYLKKYDEVENKKDFTALVNERCELESKLLKRKFELLSGFLDSDTYKALFNEERRISAEIVGCIRIRRNLNDKVKMITDSRLLLHISSFNLDMINASFVDTSIYDNQLNNLNEQLNLLKLKMEQLYKELDVVQNKMSNFQIDEYCLKDEVYIEICKKIDDIKSNMQSFGNKTI